MSVVSTHLVASLRSALSPDRVLTELEDILPYSFDGTAALKVKPGAVVFPHSGEEVSACVKLARTERVPVVTRGSGTGLSGGSVPIEGCLVICVAQMDKILEVDEKNLTLRAQCGAITKDIDDDANKVGLFYPPDPGSMKISTTGGNVPSRACLRHDLTRAASGSDGSRSGSTPADPLLPHFSM